MCRLIDDDTRKALVKAVMYMVQLLLPLYDNENRPIDRQKYEVVRREMTEHFGGLTAFMRSPAEGFWKDDKDRVDRDDIVVFEVMAEQLERDWWQRYRETLEERFRQQEIVLRAIRIEKL